MNSQISNAHVERIFSQTKLIKNNLRNKMQINTLDNHLMILLNCPVIQIFNFEKAYEHWKNKKQGVLTNDSYFIKINVYTRHYFFKKYFLR